MAYYRYDSQQNMVEVSDFEAFEKGEAFAALMIDGKTAMIWDNKQNSATLQNSSIREAVILFATMIGLKEQADE